MMPRRFPCLMLLAAFASAEPLTGWGAESGAHGPEPSPLRVSDNGRVLVDATGRPVFVLADTAWSLVLRTKREEAEAYLRQRRTQCFNAVAFVLFAPGRSQLTNTLERRSGNGFELQILLSTVGKPLIDAHQR
jgi:hypothetical protein